jgi:hypothetical protein
VPWKESFSALQMEEAILTFGKICIALGHSHEGGGIGSISSVITSAATAAVKAASAPDDGIWSAPLHDLFKRMEWH